MRRSGNFYYKNEAEVMESLNMKQTPGSGNGWLMKEDGQSDTLICQLKSTDAQSITVKQKDIRILEKNATTAHKLPIFAIQFLNTGEVWLMAKPEDFSSVAEYIQTGQTEVKTGIDFGAEDITVHVPITIGSASSSREAFHQEQTERFKKENTA